MCTIKIIITLPAEYIPIDSIVTKVGNDETYVLKDKVIVHIGDPVPMLPKNGHLFLMPTNTKLAHDIGSIDKKTKILWHCSDTEDSDREVRALIEVLKKLVS